MHEEKHFTSAMKSRWSPPSCLAQQKQWKTAATPGRAGASEAPWVILIPSHLFERGLANRLDMSFWFSVSTLIVQFVACSHSGRLAARRSTLKRTRGGSSD